MLPFFRDKVEGICDEDSQIPIDILEQYKTPNLENCVNINTDWVKNRAGNKERDNKRKLKQRYIKRDCKRLYLGRASKWELIATWLIDIIETDMRAGSFYVQRHYTME